LSVSEVSPVFAGFLFGSLALTLRARTRFADDALALTVCEFERLAACDKEKSRGI